jgi:glucose/arabinose dehydrogenase
MQFMADGTLLLSLGDGFRYMNDAQSTENTHGTIVRINPDGSIPDDNPFVGVEGAKPEVYSYGHRNVQGLFVDPATNTVYAHEHGPKGGDELNIITPGLNYGWPEITYGVNYDGTVITKKQEAEGLEQPYVKWVPSIAPSGMTLYTGDKYEGWTGDLIIGAMNGPAGLKLVRVDLEDGQIGDATDYLESFERPIRDVVQGIDGYLYIVTNELDGGVFRIDPIE